MTFALQDRLRQVAILLGVIGMIVGSYITEITGIGVSIQDVSQDTVTPLLPIGFAFSIWFPIFLGLLHLGFYYQWRSLPLRAYGGWLAAALLMIAAWVTASQLTGNKALNLPGAAASLILLLLSYRQRLRSPEPNRVVAATLGLLTGWITMATAVVVAATLKYRGPDNFGLSDTAASLAILALTASGVVALIRANRGRDLWYVGAVLWGLGGMAVGNVVRDFNPVMLAAIAAVALLILLVAVRQRKT